MDSVLTDEDHENEVNLKFFPTSKIYFHIYPAINKNEVTCSVFQKYLSGSNSWQPDV